LSQIGETEFRGDLLDGSAAESQFRAGTVETPLVEIGSPRSAA
jgi:hypothetical protein